MECGVQEGKIQRCEEGECVSCVIEFKFTMHVNMCFTLVEMCFKFIVSVFRLTMLMFTEFSWYHKLEVVVYVKLIWRKWRVCHIGRR